MSIATRAATEYFTFDGTPSYDFKCLVFPSEIDTVPLVDYNPIAVNGRIGDLLIDNMRFGNVEHSYDCIIYENFDTNFANLREFLLSEVGYKRLSDTFHSDEHYRAYFAGDFNPVVWKARDIGKFKLTFMRQPQRWLNSGTSFQLLTNGITNGNQTTESVTNPTKFFAEPLFRVNRSTSYNDAMFEISFWSRTKHWVTSAVTEQSMQYKGTYGYYKNYDYLYFDTRTYNAYVSDNDDGSTMRSYVNISNHVAYAMCADPVSALHLNPSESTEITVKCINRSIGKVYIMPRWYRL